MKILLLKILFSRYNPLFIFSLVIVMLAIISCRKKQDQQPIPVKTVLMTFNFAGNYIYPQLGAIVFASDAKGNVIADTSFTGNGTVKLIARQGAAIPSKFTLTVATWEPSMHNFSVSIRSYLQVSPGEWTLQGHRPDTLGTFTINLSNVPQSALILYGNAGFANLTTVINHAVDLCYVDPDDLCINMMVNQTRKYRWLSDIHPGGVYNVDMSDAIVPAFANISLSGLYYEARVWGYKSTDYENSLPIMTNFSLGSVPAGNLISVPVLPERFQGYHTELRLIESWDSMATYTCRVNGKIPAAFLKINAHIASKMIYPGGKIEVHPTGDFTTTAANWVLLAHNNQTFSWTLYGSDSTTHFNLPIPSPSMVQMFPVLALDSMIFYNIELTRYPGINSYDDFLKHRFDPVQPHSQEKMDASTLISGQGK